MYRLLFISISLIFSLVSAKLFAIEVNDLYQVTVAVDSQDAKQRQQAITKAIEGVFLKVGGKKSVLRNKHLLKAKRKPSPYINKYRYQRQSDELSLVVSFNESKINALFNKAGLALWGSLRPQVLLWLIDEQGASRSIVAFDADTELPSTVTSFATQRGLPVVMPLMDLTDTEQVVLSDFWGYFPEQIQQASSRYYADMVVVMRVSDSSLVSEEITSLGSMDLESTSFNKRKTLCKADCLTTEETVHLGLDWKVYTQDALYLQRYQGTDKVSLITEGLSDITELIYRTYALSATEVGSYLIDVENVTSLKNDTQLFEFLNDLSAVKSVTLISAQGDTRRYKLELLGSEASFLSSLKLNSQLTQLLKPHGNMLESTEFTSEFTSEQNSDNYSDTFSRAQFEPLSNSGMKVIELGLNVDTEKADVIVDESINDIEKPVDAKDALIPDDDFDELATEGLLPVVEKKVPLTMVPNIPVFHWEQG